MIRIKERKFGYVMWRKTELNSQRNNVQICLGKMTEQVSSAQSRTGDEHLIKLTGKKGELEQSVHERNVNINFEKKNCTSTYIL